MHQLLGAIHLRQEGSKYKLEFFNSETVRAQFPAATAPTPSKDEDIYLIVRSLKDKHNENKGYKLRTPCPTQAPATSSNWADWSTWSLRRSIRERSPPAVPGSG